MKSFNEFIQNTKAKFNKLIRLNQDPSYSDEKGDTSDAVFGIWRRESPILTDSVVLETDPCKFYSSFQLDWPSATTLGKFASRFCNNIVPPEEMHSTVVWSTTEVRDYEPFARPVTLSPTTYKYAILGNCWVLTYDHFVPRYQYALSKSKGATFTFDKYIPHITLSYEPGEYFDFSDVPLPTFPIRFSREMVEPK